MGIGNEYVKTFTKEQAQEIYEKAKDKYEKDGNLEGMELSTDIEDTLIFSHGENNMNELVRNKFNEAILKILEGEEKVSFSDMFKQYRNGVFFVLEGMPVI